MRSCNNDHKLFFGYSKPLYVLIKLWRGDWRTLDDKYSKAFVQDDSSSSELGLSIHLPHHCAKVGRKQNSYLLHSYHLQYAKVEQRCHLDHQEKLEAGHYQEMQDRYFQRRSLKKHERNLPYHSHFLHFHSQFFLVS